MNSSIYTNPPYWFVQNPRNKDVKVTLQKNGWVAKYPNGREEIIVAMKNVPVEFLGESKPVKKVEEPKPVDVPVETVETVETKVEETLEETPVEEHKEEEPKEEPTPKKSRRKSKE